MTPVTDRTNSAHAIIESLYPVDVTCVFSACPPQNFKLLPGETDRTNIMSAKRYREFCHGRSCARAALAANGLPNQPVPVGKNRQPIWPLDVVGSITHHGDIAIAVVAPKINLRSLGVDLAAAEPLGSTLPRLIARPDEIKALGQLVGIELAPTVIFSVKESIFKCLWPILHRYIDFLDIELRPERTDGAVTAVPRGEFTPTEALLCQRIKGHYALWNGLISSGAAITPDPHNELPL